MKAKIITLATFLASSFAIFGQADNWQQIVGNGFGDVNNTEVDEFFVFKDKIFAATRRPAATGAAQLWVSSTGDIGSWSKIVFSPAIPPQANAIPTVHTTALGGGIAYIGTTNMISGGGVYRSVNGSSWTQINTNGFGTKENFMVAPTMQVFKGSASQDYLYVGTRNTTTGAQVWRTPYDNTTPSNWTKVADFSTIDTSVKTPTYGYVFNNKLYVGTDGTTAYLYESADGSAWSKNTGVGNGFGISTNRNIASMVEFNGMLYATTHNPTTGGQLWRSADGDAWTSVTSDAFGKGNSIDELHNLRVANGILWVTGQWTVGTSAPTVVWKSYDGLNFIQSNTDGFGDANNNGGFPVVTGFGNRIYCGVQNTTTGAQLWRACLPTNSVLNISACNSYASPSGNYVWTAPGTYSDTIANAAGCDSIMSINLTINTADTSVTNSVSSLTANATGAIYQWLDCDNNHSAIPGATSQTFTPAASGNYAVSVTENGCTDTSSCYNIIATGIFSNNAHGGVVVYPNPAGELLVIEQHVVIQNRPFEITDITGRIILKGVLTGNRILIDLSKNKNGVYLLNINGHITRLVKE